MMANHSIAVFGASGGTGRKVIEAAVSRGWRVRALVRSTSAEIKESTQIEVWKGNLLSIDTVLSVVMQTDAVCCLYGPRPPYTDLFCAEATRVVVDAMKRQGVQRLICQTGAMVGLSLPNRSLWFQWMTRAFERRHPDIAADRQKQEEVVRSSGLDWTLVKPPRLTNGPRTERVRVGTDLRVGMLSKISRSDLAEIIADEIERPRFIGQTIFVAG